MVMRLFIIRGGLIVSPLPEVRAGLTLSFEFLTSLLRFWAAEPLLFYRLVLGGDFLFISIYDDLG